MPAVVFDADSVDAPRGLISQLVLQLERRVEANPIPTHEGDHHLVLDRLALGARIGAALVAGRRDDLLSALDAGPTLRAPAPKRTISTTGFSTCRLPQGFWQKDRGEEFLLVQEDYVDLRAGLLTEDLSGSVPPVGATASLGRVRLVTNDARVDETAVCSRIATRSRHVDSTVQAFANAVFVHVPLLQRGAAKRARSQGRGSNCPTTPDALRDELDRFVRGGSSEELERARFLRSMSSRSSRA